MQNPDQPRNEKQPRLYRLVAWAVFRLSPKYTLSGAEHFPDESCVIVGNHAQMYGPLAAEFYMPRPHATWCIGEMMDRKQVPAYAFQDFWSMKPERTHWFYRLLSRLIAPIAEYLFTHAHTIPVYRDARVVTTFRKSIDDLQAGTDVVILPESAAPFNGILWQFQEHFVELAKLYYRRTGRILSFVPMYVTPRLKIISFGAPVRYNPEAPDVDEDSRICAALMHAITGLAAALPPHRVIPYPNIPKDQYPMNTDAFPDSTPAE